MGRPHVHPCPARGARGRPAVGGAVARHPSRRPGHPGGRPLPHCRGAGAAVPAEGAGRRRAALPADPPGRRHRRGRLRPGGRRRHPPARAPPHLPRRLGQAGAAVRTHPVRRIVRLPPGGPEPAPAGLAGRARVGCLPPPPRARCHRHRPVPAPAGHRTGDRGVRRPLVHRGPTGCRPGGEVPGRPERYRHPAAQPGDPAARRRHLPRPRQPARLPPRCRRGGDGRQRQRGARRDDAQAHGRGGTADGDAHRAAGGPGRPAGRRESRSVAVPDGRCTVRAVALRHTCR